MNRENLKIFQTKDKEFYIGEVVNSTDNPGDAIITGLACILHQPMKLLQDGKPHFIIPMGFPHLAEIDRENPDDTSKWNWRKKTEVYFNKGEVLFFEENIPEMILNAYTDVFSVPGLVITNEMPTGNVNTNHLKVIK